MDSKENTMTVGQFLLDRLDKLGVKQIFGIPGDYVLRLNKLIEEHPHIDFINTTRESSAGYAANAYAHFQGLGVSCITYGVGIEIIAPLTQAHVESYPVVVISGTIADEEYKKNQDCHHLINKVIIEGRDSTQFEIFKNLTIDQALLHSPATAAAAIDRVLKACLQHKKPVYIEIPRNIVDQALPCTPPPFSLTPPLSNPKVLEEALKDTQRILSTCQYPIIWVGHEILRYNLSTPLLDFAEKHRIPIVSSLLGKTAIDEHHPLFVGVYQGEMSSERILEIIKKCDCFLMAGVVLNDIDTGIFTAKLDQDHRIRANSHQLTIGHHHYPIQLVDYIQNLHSISLPHPFSLPYTSRHDSITTFEVIPKAKTTMKRVFECLQTHLTTEHIVVSDVGDSLFASADLALAANSFISNSYFASIGTGTPTAIGAEYGDPTRRIIAIVGDGGFQMSAMELSTAVRYHLDPIFIVLNNHGYGTERVLLEGSFNDLVNWNYTQIPQVLGGGIGIKADSEETFQEALKKALTHRGTFYLIEVELDKTDFSPSLQRLGKFLSKIVKNEK